MLARFQATIVDENGDIVPNADIEVRHEGSGSLVSLFSDRDGNTGIGNPTTADANGFIGFHVTGGAYRIDASSSGFSRTWRYVGIANSSETDVQDEGTGLLLREDGDASDLEGITAGQVGYDGDTDGPDNVQDAIDELDPGVAKGWVQFDSTPSVSIRASHNVSSVTDHGTGDYTVNWDTPMSGDYSVQCSTETGLSSERTVAGRDPDNSPSSGAVRIRVIDVANNNAVDQNFIDVWAIQ